MEISNDLNVFLNLITAALVAYTARTLRGLRTDLAGTAEEVRRELVEERRRKNGH